MSKIKLIASGVLVLVLLITTAMTVQFATIKGNEYGVLETWGGGVQDDILQPKTHVLIPGFMNEVYVYDGNVQMFVMNNDPNDVAEGRTRDPYKVQSVEGQDMTISLACQWRIDPAKLVDLHKTVRDKIEERVLRPELMRIVKDEATSLTAISAYSGEGLVKLQSDIEDKLKADDGDLKVKGIIVENFVIEKIDLDPEYIGEIRAKQVAQQRELRAKEEEKAALAEAQKAKAEAQADYEKAVVQAERDKQVGILDAEKSKETQVLAAQAQQQKLVLEAQGHRDAAMLEAEGIEAVGAARAEAIRLELQAYQVEGAALKARVDISKNLSTAFQGIQGYIPEGMKINVISESFMNSITSVVGGAASAAIP